MRSSADPELGVNLNIALALSSTHEVVYVVSDPENCVHENEPSASEVNAYPLDPLPLTLIVLQLFH